jgi:hypothetical protein
MALRPNGEIVIFLHNDCDLSSPALIDASIW